MPGSIRIQNALMAGSLALGVGCSGLKNSVSVYAIPADGEPRGVSGLDFDGDGEPELLSLYQDSAVLGVYRLPARDATAGTRAGHDAQRFTLDGRASAIHRWTTQGRRPGFVAVFPSEGKVVAHAPSPQGWQRYLVYAGPTGPIEALPVDLDGDGLQDVALVSADDERQLVLVHNTGHGFASPTAVPLNPRPRATPTLAAADFQGNGLADLLCGMPTGSIDTAVPDHLRLFRGNQAGSLSDETWYAMPWPQRVATGDVDGDGNVDAVGFGRSGAWLAYGLGDGWLDKPRRVMSRSFVDGHVADLDGDGRAELVGLDNKRAELRVLSPVGPRRFTTVATFAVGQSPVSLAHIRRGPTSLLVTANARSSDFTVLEFEPT